MISAVATARNVGAAVSRIWDVTVTAAHLVPARGPVVLAGNHTALLDGPLLAAVSPRPLQLLAKSDLFTGPLGWLLRTAGQIPLRCDSPARAALHQALDVLGDDGAVGVFPEGHRGPGDVRHAQHGVAYLAARSAAPVVPVALLGTRPSGSSYGALPPARATIHVVFGPPLRLTGRDATRRHELAGLGEQIRQQLADHVHIACQRTGCELPAPPTSNEAAIPA